MVFFLKKIHKRLCNFLQVNWFKTLYLNFKLLPFEQAAKLPIIVFGQCSVGNISGKIIFTDHLRMGMLTFGHRFEIFKKASNISEIVLKGTWKLNGAAQFGYDFKLYIEKEAYLETGKMNTFANNTKLVCCKKIILGNYVKIGDESQLQDTTFHNMFNLSTNQTVPKEGEILIGSYVSVGNRVSITKNAIVPDFSLIASNSLCNKSLVHYGENNLFGGIPVKLIRKDYTRDWKLEEKELEEYLKIKL